MSVSEILKWQWDPSGLEQPAGIKALTENVSSSLTLTCDPLCAMYIEYVVSSGSTEVIFHSFPMLLEYVSIEERRCAPFSTRMRNL